MRITSEQRATSVLLQLARWLLAPSLAVIAAAALVVGAWRVPSYAATHLEEFLPTQAWTPETLATAMTQLGWHPLTVAWVQFARDAGGFVAYMALGLLLLFRGPRTWFGTYAALTFIALGYANSISRLAGDVVPAFGVVSSVVGQIAWQLLFILFYLFPDGHFVPRWTRWLLVPWIALNLLPLPGVASAFPIATWWWVPVPLVLTAIGSQVYRYFWRADPVQRAQTKWVVYVVGLLAPLMLVYGFIVPLMPERAPAADVLGATLRTTLIWGTLSWAAGLLIPLSLVIAILRYRLWDIDLIIRKTLVYALLSGLLALVYFGLVVSLQTLFDTVSGQQSPAVIVISTLAIAALFAPLRQRVQTFIDRRFYRKKYNAQQILAQFAQTARDETDMDRLTTALVTVVRETMPPEVVSLWLKPETKKAHDES